jgi:hypothetical protein
VKIEYLHESKFGNGATVAAEFQKLMAAKGVSVEVRHIRDVKPTELMPADVAGPMNHTADFTGAW